MKKLNGTLAFLLLLTAAICNGQNKRVADAEVYVPQASKSLHDKLFEFGVPMLFIILLLHIIVTVLKNRADQRLKLKMVENGVSEETLIKIFRESNDILKLQPLKYFLVCLSIGVSFLVIHFTDEQKYILLNQSGYYVLGIFLLITSCAFYIYYRILCKKL